MFIYRRIAFGNRFLHQFRPLGLKGGSTTSRAIRYNAIEVVAWEHQVFFQPWALSIKVVYLIK
jgi:hypothetical protein